MKNYLTKTQADIEKQTTKEKACYSFGEIHPHTLGTWDEEFSKTDEINILISFVGKFKFKRNVFQKTFCPVCNKKELEIYDCCASVLSGAHVLRGVCKNCGEIIAFEDSDLYRKIRDYVISENNIIRS